MAPLNNLDVINSLNLATTIPTLIFSDTNFPSNVFILLFSFFALIFYSCLILQKMSHSSLFCPQVPYVMGICRCLDGYPFHNLHAEVLELVYFIWIIRKEPQSFCSQIPKDLGSDIILPFISLKAKGKVCLQGIHPLFLKLICPELIDQSDPSSFLAHIEKNPSSLLFDLPHSCMKLLAAVAAERTESIACKALGMNPAEKVFSFSHLSFHKSHMVFSIQLVNITVSSKMPVSGRHICLSHLFYQFFMTLPVILKILYGKKWDPPLFCHLGQL